MPGRSIRSSAPLRRAERRIGTLRRELLDRTTIWNQRQVRRLIVDYLGHHNTHRPHLGSAPDLTVVGEAEDGQSAIELVCSTRADVVLMDIRMPGLDGLAATRTICADDDLAGVKVIVLTTFELDEYVIQAVQAGASGFLGKGVGPSELLEAIRLVAAGDALLSPKATKALLARFSRPAAHHHRNTPAHPRHGSEWNGGGLRVSS